jgi:ABC-type branched-subunit amino acid transport system ATPase component
MSIEIMSRLTLDDLLDQLEQARQMAIEERKPTAMIQATVTTAKLLGLDKPVIKDVNAGEVQTISDLMDALANDDQLLTKRISHAKDEY